MDTNAPPPLADGRNGRVSRRIFFSDDIYRTELERLFARCWLYLGHESQIARPGDFVTNYMGEDPVILWRDRHGGIRAFLNSCRHRGMKLCRTDAGNARQLTCIFHGWTYSDEGALVGVPQRAAYGDRLAADRLGLWEVPKVASYGGLVFATWDAAAVGLDDYLGEMRWYLDVLLERAVGKWEALPGQQRFALKANWKIAAENFAGDCYHVPYAHASMRRAKNVRPFNPVAENAADTLRCFTFKGGHGLAATGVADERYASDVAMAREMGPEVTDYVRACRARLEACLSARQARIYALGFGNVFPHFSFNDFSALRPTGLYLWHPKGPDLLEAWQWCLIDSAAPDAVKEMIRVDFSRGQSATGFAGQDDTENFEQVTEATRGVIGQALDFHYGMGLAPDAVTADGETIEGYPGLSGPFFSEIGQRGFYRRWAELVDDG